MNPLRRHLPGLAIACFVLLPITAFAAGAPTPTPAPAPPRPGLSQPPPTPTSQPPAATALPTAIQAIATPSSQPTGLGATATPEASPTALPSPTNEPSPTPEATPTAAPSSIAAAAPAAEASPTDEPIPYDAFSIWHGVVREGGAYRRSAPSSAGVIEEELDPGTPIRVDGWVGGSMLYPDVITWAAVDPLDGGGYIFGGSLEGVLPPAVPPPPQQMQTATGTWIDVNLTLNVVTAYEDGQPVKMMLTSPGRPGYETDIGLFSVYSKLLSQTMTGPGYVVPAVPHVQYFFGGEALHGRYWTLPDVLGQTSADIDDNGQIEDLEEPDVQGGGTNSGVAFGVPSSHGCLGLNVTDATWLYSLTGYGTPVDVHY